MQSCTRGSGGTLAAVLLLATACQTPSEPGRFEVEFRFRDDPPTERLWTFARVEQRRGAAESAVVAEAEIVAYEPGVRLEFTRVPNGSDYVVGIELRDGERKSDRVRYFGESERFTLEPGEHTRVAVELALAPTPGSAAGTSIAVVEAIELGGRLLVASERVTLRLRPENADRVVVAHDPALSLARSERALSELEREGDAYLWPEWSLDRGLCAEPPCGDGARRVFAQFVNAYDFTSEVFDTGTITLDSSAPVLVNPTVSPALAGAGAQVVIRASFDEPVASATLDDGALAFEVQDAVGNSYSWQTVVEPDEVEGEHELRLSARDLVGNELRMAALPRLTIDTTAPTASDVEIDRTLLRAGEQLELTFGASERLQQPARVFLGSDELQDCDRTLDGARERYRCTATVATDQADGRQALQAELSDLAGNRVTAELGQVDFDVELPQLLGASLAREPQYLPAVDADETWFSARDPFTGAALTATLTLVADKTLGADPEVRAFLDGDQGSALAFTLQRRTGSTAVFTHAFDSSALVAGSYLFEVTWHDAEGNARSEPVPVRLRLQTERPQNSVDPTQTLYRRIPWGAQETGGVPRFGVSGVVSGADAVEVLVATAPNPAAGYLAGRAPVAADGSFEVSELTSGDSVDLYVAVVDRSGSVSDFVPVTEGEWVATLGGKVAGSALENPHQITSWQAMPGALTDPEVAGVEASGAAVAHLDFDPQLPATREATRGAFRWRRGTSSGEVPQASYAAFYDPFRGGVGLVDDGLTGSELWTWNGAIWTRGTLSCRLPPLASTFGYYDPSLARYVLFTEQRVDVACADWITFAPGPAPGAHQETGFAFDVARGRLVLLAAYDSSGTPTGEVWEWDGEHWMSIAPAGAKPEARIDPAVAYDPERRRVLMFGGRRVDGSRLDDLWEWDGVSFTRLSAPGPWPAARSGAFMAYARHEQRLLLLGGDKEAGGPTDFWAWDGAQWELLSDDAEPGGPQLTMAYDPVRQRTVVGTGSARGDVWEWDGEQWQHIEPLGPAPGLVSGAALAFDDTDYGRLTLFGGVQDDMGYLEGTWVWIGDRWVEVPTTGPTPAPRVDATLFNDPSSLVLFGGTGAQDYDDIWRWDGREWSEVTTPGLRPPGGSGVSMAYDDWHQEGVLFDRNGATWIWDGEGFQLAVPATGTPEARTGAAMASDYPRERLIMLGGRSTITGQLLGDAWAWDGASWTPVSELAHEAEQAGLLYDPEREELLLHGGIGLGYRDQFAFATYVAGPLSGWDLIDERGADYFSPHGDEAIAYDWVNQRITLVKGPTWQWSGGGWFEVAIPTTRATTSAASIAYEPGADRVLIQTAVRESDFPLASVWEGTWTWDDRGFRQLPVPGLRAYPLPQFEMATDTARNRTLLFGGNQSGGRETWEWDGRDWEELDVGEVAGPVARSLHALAYDSTRGRVVLYGGRADAGGALGDAWSRDAQGWTPLDVTGGPVAMCAHAMAYDEHRDRMVLYGADCTNPIEAAQTWEWDGGRWYALGEGPVTRHSPFMVYDRQRRRSLLIGGLDVDRNRAIDEVWEWDGSSWQEVTPSAYPRTTQVPTPGAFDSARNRVVRLEPSLDRVTIGDFDSKPGQLAAFTLDALAPPARKVQPDELTIVARAGGNGTEQRVPQPGAQLSLWDGLGWRAAACNEAGNTAPDTVSVSTRDPQVIRAMQVRNALRFALSPIAKHGDGPLATVTTDYVEVRVRYHLGDVGVDAVPEAGWHASAACPGVEAIP